jgi:hypothetical protein
LKIRRLASVRAVIPVLSVVALVAFPSPSVAGAPVPGQVTPNTRLTSDKSILRGHDLPGLAVDPTNPSHIVLMEENFLAGQCDFHTSFDGGQTWTDGVLTAPSDFADPPCRTFDSGGYAHFNQSVVFGSGQNVYTVFASHRGAQERPEIHVVQGEGDSLIVSHSSDGGKTFQTGVVAIHGSPMSQPYVIRPGIAVDPRPSGDRLYVEGWSVFVTSGGAQGGGGDRQLVTSVSNDGGATWSAPVAAQAPGEHIREPAPPVVGPDGAVYVAYRNRDAPSTDPHPVVVAKSTDAGMTWTRTTVAQMLPGPMNANNAAGFPRLAIDPKSNTLYVVYQNFATAGNVDLYVQQSTDGGATFSTPVQVNDDPSNPAVDHIAGRVAVAPNGRLDVVWVDGRNAYPTAASLMATPEGDIYYASSTDGGKTFSSNRRITDHSINFDTGLDQRVGSDIWYAPALAPIGNDAVMFAWGDPRLGNVDTDNQDIETATLRLNSSAPPEVQNLPRANPTDESIAASLLAYPAGAERIGSSASTKVVIAPTDDPASALAGAVLARANFGPLLLSSRAGLSKQLKDEITRLRPSGAYLVGTTPSLSPQVDKDLAAAGVSSVMRLTGATAADVAASVAKALDTRSAADTTKGTPVAPAAVIVNPASSDAAAGAGLASSLGYPLLFTNQNDTPSPTTASLHALAIANVLVVGGPSSVSDGVVNQLTGAKRLSGSDAGATSVAVAAEAVARGVPANMVYVADPGRPADAAVAAAAVGRVGGLLVLAPHASATEAQSELSQAHLTVPLDQMVIVRSKSGAKSNTTLIIIFIALGAIGFLLLMAAFALRVRARERAAAIS